jgi:hypothetical protein
LVEYPAKGLPATPDAPVVFGTGIILHRTLAGIERHRRGAITIARLCGAARRPKVMGPFEIAMRIVIQFTSSER